MSDITTEQSDPLRAALQQIADWRLPETGQFWDDERTRPVAYETQYGSLGAREYMRRIAREALAAPKAAPQEGGPA